MALVLVAAAIGGLLFIGAVLTVRMIANGPPPEPDPDAIHEVEVLGLRDATHGDPCPGCRRGLTPALP